MVNDSRTIAAIVTPPGKGGVGIVRVSGHLCQHIAQQVVKTVPKPRQASLLPFYDQAGDLLDQGLALYFPNPHSFTGEDVLELHGHGGPVVMDQLLQAVIAAGAEMANPGEFSERAFLNGKMDLAQAEAIADLINASSKQAAKSAARSLTGAFSKHINALLQQLTALRMFVEASIDFVDEDIDFIGEAKIIQQCQGLQQELESILKTTRQGVLLRDGLRVVIAGKPNAGKSSLLNRLTGEHTAIVTDIAGTTRDVLKEYIELDGLPLHIVDTAGLRETSDIVEQHGIARAKEAMQQADLILLVVDAVAANQDDDWQTVLRDVTQQYHDIPVFILMNKIDQLNGALPETPPDYQSLAISAKQAHGLDQLIHCIKDFAGFSTNEQSSITARRRHLLAIEKTATRIDAAVTVYEQQRAHELLAEELRQAQDALAQITGAFRADDLLGKIFSEFCIGK